MSELGFVTPSRSFAVALAKADRPIPTSRTLSSTRPFNWTSQPAILCLLLLLLLAPMTALAEEAGDLIAGLVRGSEGARTTAASRLYHLGEADRGVPPLLARLRGEDPVERCLAARLLGMLRSRRAVASLTAALDDDDPAVRRNVIDALAQIGDASTSSALSRALDDPIADVRIAAARALREIGVTRDLAPALERETESEVRLHLVEALSADRTPPSERALRGALSDESELVRLLAASYLIERGNEDALQVLAPRLRHDSATVRRETAVTLGRARAPVVSDVRDLLFSLLDDPSHEVGLAAATSLATLDDQRGIEHLRAISRGDAPAAVRASALEALERVRRSEDSP